MTIHDWLQQATAELKPASRSPRLDAELLLEHVTGKTRAQVLAYSELLLERAQQVDLSTMLKRRKNGEPMGYIIGTSEFYGHLFKVNEAVLIPRPESEAFLDLLNDLRNSERIHNVIDVGTGSGALAISAKLAHTDLHVTATDISTAALKIAAQNSMEHKAPITLRKQSLLTGDKEGYEVLLANLPYVPEGVEPDPSIAYEPREALFSGHDGLQHYIKLFEQLEPKHIRFVLTESLTSQHGAVAGLAAKAGYTLKETMGLVQLFSKIEDIHSLK